MIGSGDWCSLGVIDPEIVLFMICLFIDLQLYNYCNQNIIITITFTMTITIYFNLGALHDFG